MDFEQQLRKAFAPCHPRPELRSTILARRSALVRSAGIRSRGSRTILFGSIFAVAAAAAMLAGHLMDQPAMQPVAAAPAQVSAPDSAGVAAALPPMVPTVLDSSKAASVPSVSAPRSLDRSSRPDAGYYNHPGKLYGSAGESFFYSMLVKREEDRQYHINTIVGITGVDRYTADRFLDYIKDAMEDLTAYKREVTSAYATAECEQRDDIKTIKQLAALITRVDVAVEARRSEMTRGSESILGAGGMKNLEIYLSNRDRNSTPHVERNEERLLEMGLTPAELLNARCGVR